VPSPLPEKIIEINTIKKLWKSTIAIACGGGGIPVIEKDDGSVEGIAAVIDKDLAAEKLAEDINADILMILTEVEKVALNFKQPNQKNLSEMTVAEAEQYIEEGHFAPGSMLPKMEASVKFVKSKPGRKAIITSLFKSAEALRGKAGTVINLS
jgi:carbamate kinase